MKKIRLFFKKRDEQNHIKLTTRQREILKRYGELKTTGGRSCVSNISYEMKLSDHAIHWHLKVARERLDVSSSLDAYLKAKDLNLLDHS